MPCLCEFLSFLSEIGESERCGRLIFLFVFHTCDYKNDDSHEEGKHLEDLLARKGDAGDILGGNVERAKNDGAEDTEYRLPSRENNESYA